MKYFLIFFLFTSAAFAAQSIHSHRAIVEGEVLRGSFSEERRLKDFKAPLLSSGHFAVIPGKGLIWEVEKPFAVTTIITPNGIVQQAGTNQVMNLPAKQVPFLLHLYQMLSGALAGEWSAFSRDFEIKTSETPKGAWQLQLTPKNKEDVMMPFSMINIMGTEFAEHVELNKPDGDADIITFSEQKLSTEPLTKQEAALLTKLP